MKPYAFAFVPLDPESLEPAIMKEIFAEDYNDARNKANKLASLWRCCFGVTRETLETHDDSIYHPQPAPIRVAAGQLC